MSKLLTTLIAAVFAVTTTAAIAQAPAAPKGDAPKSEMDKPKAEKKAKTEKKAKEPKPKSEPKPKKSKSTSTKSKEAPKADEKK